MKKEKKRKIKENVSYIDLKRPLFWLLTALQKQVHEVRCEPQPSATHNTTLQIPNFDFNMEQNFAGLVI